MAEQTSSSSSSSTPLASSTEPITLRITTLDTRILSVSVPLQETVLQLKERLAVLLQVPSPRQRLIFQGRLLRDEDRLNDYALRDGHTIHLVTRPADAPVNPSNDIPRLNATNTTSTTTGAGPVDYQFHIIDGMESQLLMHALAGHLPMLTGLNGLNPRVTFGTAVIQGPGASATRPRTSTSRRGQGLPHLESIRAEMRRVSAQLRNVETILRRSEDEQDEVALESLEVASAPETGDAAFDGDSTDLSSMSNMLTVLSDTSRMMARSLETLAGEYNQSRNLDQPLARQMLQRMSLRAARAMHRLASVQNTVFPMLANANFTGARPGPVLYRFQPTSGRRSSTAQRPAQTTQQRPASGSSTTSTTTSATTSATTSTTASSRPHQFPSVTSDVGRAGTRTHTFHFGPFSASRQPRPPTSSINTTTAASSTSSASSASSTSAPSGTRETTLPSIFRPIGTFPMTGGFHVVNLEDFQAAMGLGLGLGLRPPSRSTVNNPAPGSISTTTSSTAPTSATTRSDSLTSRSRPRDIDDLLLEGDSRASQRRRLDLDDIVDPSSAIYNRGVRASASQAQPSTSSSSRRPVAEASSPASSSSPSSPSLQGSSSNASTTPAATPAYNLGRIGVFISAILRMVDQPREDGSPRTLADVICNDPESMSTPLQELVRNVAESITVRETRSIVEGYPAPLRNIHSTLSTFIREQALMGQQLTESNLEAVAVMFSESIMNAVHVEEFLETLSPPASIPFSAADIRRISLDVLREHFRRLIYLVVAAPAGRESTWPTFARDLILWIRDVVGAWRVAFYSLYPERDQAEAQRFATHVVGSAIHANGRRWVELSNRATNTLVNVLCANIVPRRRGEEQSGGLVGGAWPLMATGPGPRSSRSATCMAPSLLGSTAPPAPLGPTTSSASSSSSFSSSSTATRPSSSTASSSTASSSSAPSTSRSSGGRLPNMEGFNMNDLLSMSAEEAYQSLQRLWFPSRASPSSSWEQPPRSTSPSASAPAPSTTTTGESSNAASSNRKTTVEDEDEDDDGEI
ncbi:hypothetical protein CPB97_006960 [Podila verticillata]|nr:hypothetical protein CPB97_006960 [Podila verticillata]